MAGFNGIVLAGAAPKKTKRAFLASGTAYTGYAMCYNVQVVDQAADTDTGYTGYGSITASIASWCDARRAQVVAPATSVNCYFAGVVDESSNGVVGPNWIMIHEPGSCCYIKTGAVASVAVTARATGFTMSFTIAKSSVDGVGSGNGQFWYSGNPGRGTAVLLAEGAATVPNDTSLKMAYLQEGMESGGVQTLASMTQIMGKAGNTLGCINHGRIYFGDAVTTGPENACQISVPAGKFLGQHLVIGGPVSAASCLVSVDVANACVAYTSGAAALAAAVWITCSTGNLTASTQFIDLTWNGTCWVAISNAKMT